MKPKQTSPPSYLSVRGELQRVKELVYDPLGFTMSEFQIHGESREYGACRFELNGRKIEYRMSKITPAKAGQFVTIWKRNKAGITEPFDVLDEMDFIIITCREENKLGQFIFPKRVLAEKGIVSNGGKGGKRGIRVYPPWTITTNKQAEKTQSWQVDYFAFVEGNGPVDVKSAEKLLGDPG